MERIEHTLGRIETKLDLALGNNELHEKRITSLEHDRTRVLTISGMVSAAVGFVATLAFKGPPL